MSADRNSVLPDAFAPHRTRDVDGLSVYRERFHTTEEVARTFRTKGKTLAWCARLKASEVFELGLSIKPDPLAAGDGLPARSGHALISELNSGNAESDRTKELKKMLADAVFDVGTPYDPPLPGTPGPTDARP